jgi:type I restriction enzyme R subunit
VDLKISSTSNGQHDILEVFGGYIHTYKFSEGVEDGVILDLVYESRDIDQDLSSREKIDAWFEGKTRGLNDWQKDELKKHWGTLQKVLSSRSRMERLVSDILLDFSTKARLSSERGSAMLVASSIYEACKYYSLFQKTPFKEKCALVTSYNPNPQDITLEDTGANSETDRMFIYNTYDELLKNVTADPGKTKTETYEDKVKEAFTKRPNEMRLLVVVDKLLTGFDAPPCTYLYIDKSMQDHGLFQAICRTNRLDGEDKDFGYIVDYKDLFRKVETAIAVYTSELDHSAPGVEPDVMIQDRLKKGRERLEAALERLALLCEPVEPPRGDLEHIHYFCGNTELADDLQAHEPQRVILYTATASLVRAYANLAGELEGAGYSPGDIAQIQQKVNGYLALRNIIRLASGESLDLKAYEADMRHLIDTYIQADESRRTSDFDDIPLTDLLVKTGIADEIAQRLYHATDDVSVAEIIENNIRRKIIKGQLTDPAYYERMSELLQEVIVARKMKALEYERYLERIAELARQVESGHSDDTPEPLKNSPALRALYNNLRREGKQPYRDSGGDAVLELAMRIDETVRQVRPDDWRGVQTREQVIKRALYEILKDPDEVERIFRIVEAQPEY